MKPEGNFMVGIISYMPETDAGKLRIPLHKEQLRWLEALAEKTECSFPVYRVESAWGPTAQQELQSTLPIQPIVVDRHTCAVNRNFLLEKFYESDYDWLFLLDDDRIFYDHYRYWEWFDDLSTPKVMELCKDGYLISCILPMYEPFKKVNYEWPNHETHWFFGKDPVKGSLQSCFIPNIKKHCGREVYFDKHTAAQLGEPPEDTMFQLDWIKAGGRCIRNRFLIAKEVGQSAGEKSLIYSSLEERRKIEEGHELWFTQYLKQLYPRSPGCWTRRGFIAARNPEFRGLIPRSKPYQFEMHDLPRDVVKELKKDD